MRRWRHALSHLLCLNRWYVHYRLEDGKHVGGFSCPDCDRFEHFPTAGGN
jgi:hypothetical protein